MMTFRIRVAVVLLSVAVIGLELAFMRVLSLRFWHHFASMVVSVALLGFGFSGAILTLVQRWFRARLRFWLSVLAFAASVSVLLSAWAVEFVPLDVHYLPWSLHAEWHHILEIELLLMLPFLVAGGFLGLVLMDRSDKIHGHYAANLVGSGIGALVSVLMMFYVSTPHLLSGLAFLCYGAGACLTKWKDPKSALACVAVGAIWVTALWSFPSEIRISPYKKLELERLKPHAELIHTEEGPLGRIDVVRGPSIHDAPPGMSLENPYPMPQRTLVIVDGDKTHVVYAYAGKEDWRFLDYTTAAVPFAVNKPSRVLVVEPGGGAALALAHLKGSKEIDALAADRQMVDLIRNRLDEEGGKIYRIPGIHTYFETPRGYLRRTGEEYDLILIPLLDSAATGGLYAAQENYLYTVQSFRSFFRHLKREGIFCATVPAKTPPRDGLRVFNLAVEALHNERLFPQDRLALIRSWETVTLMVKKDPWTTVQLRGIRDFCKSRGFDLCYLPGLKSEEANQFHVLPRPYYYEGTCALLSVQRRQYIENYLFALNAPSDDQPYFNHFLRWRHLPELRHQLKGSMPAFLEPGSLLMVVTLAQVAALAGALVFLPLLPRLSTLKGVRKKGSVIAYFFLLGIGFMLLEMGFLQKLILYLAHPLYSAAAVIASFLVFAGIGSQWSTRWRSGASWTARAAAFVVAALGYLYLLELDPLLALTQSWDPALRLLVTALTIAPLALAMGHLFPMGLRRVSEAVHVLTPWAWAVNGFASVLAAVSTPLLAMSIGFSRLILVALACYLAAGVLFSFLPEGSVPSEARGFSNGGM
jgi:hypothetical protein